MRVCRDCGAHLAFVTKGDLCNICEADPSNQLAAVRARLRVVEAERDRLIALRDKERDEARADAAAERRCANEWLTQLHDAKKERDAAYKTIARLNRRAQEAERLVGVAMRAGLDRIWRIEDVLAYTKGRNERLRIEQMDVRRIKSSLAFKIASLLTGGR